MQGCHNIFYTPEEQYPGMPHGEMCGDIMPFYKDGLFTLFFLYKYCIYAVQTRDFVRYKNLRLVLQNGSPDEQDWHAATGSVVELEKDGRFLFYYTGFCEGNRGKAGKHEQAILRAHSKDLLSWEKDKDYFFPPDERYFAGPHWRDPHVFWNEELGVFSMLVTAAQKGGATQRGGCTAVYTSADALEWSYHDTIYAPRTYPSHECQDAFRLNGRWYLTFSTYARQWETRYRVADHFAGPWRAPADDMLDGRQLYAAKTVSDGRDRYLVGWQSIRKDCDDNGRFLWGGNVVVHRLLPRTDGTLGVGMPPAVDASFRREHPLRLQSFTDSGTWAEPQPGVFQGDAPDGFGWASLASLPHTALFETEVTWEPDARAVGLMIHASGEQLDRWLQLRLEPARGRILLDASYKTDGDQHFEDERPLAFRPGRASVKLLVSGNITQVYVDDVALTTRSYSVRGGHVGLFVEGGGATFSACRLRLQAE